MGLVFAGQVIQRARQFGDGQHAGHIGAALEGMQRPLQFITDLQRQVLGGLLQEMVEAVEVALGFVAEDFQQLRVQGGRVCGRRLDPAGQGMRPRRQFVYVIALALGIVGEIGDQLRQQFQHIIQHRLHIRARRNAAFQHAVEQVFHRPGQLRQH